MRFIPVYAIRLIAVLSVLLTCVGCDPGPNKYNRYRLPVRTLETVSNLRGETR